MIGAMGGDGILSWAEAQTDGVFERNRGNTLTALRRYLRFMAEAS